MFLPIKYQPFHLALTLTMGQALRWRMEGDGWISGVVRGKLIRVRQVKDRIEFRSSLPASSDSTMLWRYLRLGQDISRVHKQLLARSPALKHVLELYGGIRIVRQEPWECAVTYVCSPRNTVARIAKTVENLADRYGAPLYLDGFKRHSFPDAATLAAIPSATLRQSILGNKDEFAPSVWKLATEVSADKLRLKSLSRDKSYSRTRTRLDLCRGIGDKVANCVLLFSMDKPKAFPLDTNIFEALKRIYRGKNILCPIEWDQKKYSDLRDWESRDLRASAQAYFGKHAGYASQLLFHGIRDGAIQDNTGSTLT